MAAGDVVQAGQVIGFEGRKGIENGGYTPHLHLGIRDGRMFEEGMEFPSLELKGKATKFKLVHLDEKELELASDNPELTTFTLYVFQKTRISHPPLPDDNMGALRL